MRKRDLKGQRFNRLTVIEDTGERKHRKILWLCRCDCGAITAVNAESLVGGRTKSCGCWRVDLASTLNYKHGLTSHPLAVVLKGMKSRCTNPLQENYKNYGGRGIQICAEWERSLEAFVTWALNAGWQPGLQIDREDNDGNYEPSNCRFVTPQENNANRRCSKRLKEAA